MAEPEFSLQSKLKEGEENTHEEESEENDYSIGYDSDDPSFEILEGKADRKIWEQYYREWDESEDRETITEGELDKPSLVKSFVSGLVIEKLCKGKPGGIRYTGKLKENGKILGTNIGEGEPLEFRIGIVFDVWDDDLYLF
ncbi:hypothetical protein KY285_006038 [Solanum tuberosum]|nr:hypothetical protein KY289_006536 [Solanum tuberosum]KAH0752890.1 hypothetical protein KY285_006038 [Solanum tuberosum]